MTKLKLGPLPDDKPVKITVELPESFDAAVRELYDREIRASVHDRW